MSLFNNTGQVNNVNVLGKAPSSGGGLDTLAELDAVITQLNIESHTTNTNGNIATVDYVNSLVISGGSVVGSDPVLVSAGNVSLKYDNNSLVLNTSGQLVQNANYLNPLLNVSNDVNIYGASTNVNFRNTAGTILSSVNNSGDVLTLSSSNLVITGQSSVSNLNVSSTLFSTSISSGTVSSNTGTIGNFNANNLHAVINGTIGTLVSGNASITNIENSNSSISNLVATNISSSNISSNIINNNILINTTSSISNLSTTNLVSTNATQTNTLISNLSVSNLSLSGTLNQTNVNITNATQTNILNTNISSSSVNVSGRVISRVNAAGFNSQFTALPVSDNSEASISFYNNTAGSATSEGNVYVIGHNVFGSGNRTFGIGTPWNGSILTINTSGTTSFNNNLEVVRSGTIPSLLISGGITGGNGATIRLHGGGIVNSSVQIDMSTYDPGATDPTSRIRAVDENFSSNLLFQTKTPGAGSNTLSTRMYIRNDGNIGIGNTSPSQRLDVSGNIFCTGNILSNGILDVGANSAGGTITHQIKNNAPETAFNACRFLSVVSNTNKFSNMSSYLTTSGNVNFDLELSRTGGSSIMLGIDHDRQETTFRYGLYAPLDVQQDLWDLNISTGSLGSEFKAWNRLYLKGNAYLRNIYARTTGQLIGTDDTAQGYRFNILADNITSNNLIVSNISGATNLSSTNITSTNILTSNITSSSLVIRRNTSNWNPSIYLNSPTSGNENYMMFNNIAGGPISVGSWLVGTASGVTGGTFQIGFANTSPYAFNIMTSGNIGIGTTTPNYRLHVDGDLYVRTTRGILLHGSDSPMITRDFDPFTSGKFTGAGRWGLFMEGGATTLGLPAGGSGRKHQFVSYNDDSTINTTMMTIFTNGNVGLTITNPSYQLHLSQDSAGKPSSTLWTVTSDERLKTNITQANLDICYDNVKNLPLKRYTWRDEIYTEEEVPDRSKLGWIAQDVEQVIPKAVEQKDMHGYSDCRSLNADQIIASLYGAVQKLMEKCEKHEEILDIITNKSPSIRKLFNT